MPLSLYNTLGRTKAPFTPLAPGQAGLYTCGPTVYHYAHIGNLRSYLFADTLRRTLEAAGYRVNHVMNITDVGHLTSDADAGEDKLEKGAAREGKTPLEVARFYEAAFEVDIKKLNILPPTVQARATEHIAEQVAMIKQLFEHGYAYETDQAVYFDVSQLSDYTALTGQELSAKKTAVREEVVADPAKRQPADFALWFKRVGRYADHVLHWPSPWGDGFPGWHIECSAMSTKYLGVPFDIHTSGIDHIAIHHTNERAQNIGAFGREQGEIVRWWLHNEFVVLGGGERMSKSGENFITLQNIIDRGYDPVAYRYLCLGTHYRKPLAFSWEALAGAAQALTGWYSILWQPTDATDADQGTVAAVQAALEDDLNTPQALAAVWELVRSDQPLGVKQATLRAVDGWLGLGLAAVQPITIPPAVQKLADERAHARSTGDYAMADTLRQQIQAAGFDVDDTPDGQLLKPKR